MKKFVTLAVLAAILPAMNCARMKEFGKYFRTEEKPWVSVDGSKLTERDLKNDMPQAYKQLRDQYNAQLQEMLEQLAMNKMLEKAAKEKGMSLEDYQRSLQSQVPMPSEVEVAEFYKELQANNQTEGQSLSELLPRISMHLREQAGRAFVQRHIQELKKKYDYSYPYTTHDIDTAGAPVRGNPSAKVTIVEFTDFECPFCMRVQPTTTKLREKYGDKIRFVFKDFPLSFHPNAMDVHIAARCVYQTNPNRYWEFFDQMFAQNRDRALVTKTGAEKLALKLGTDAGKYNACIADPSVRAGIEASVKLGEENGVSGTPAFFINGRMLSGAQPIEAFEEIIEAEL